PGTHAFIQSLQQAAPADSSPRSPLASIPLLATVPPPVVRSAPKRRARTDPPPSESPPAPAPPVENPSARLPLPLTRFFGREEEMARLEELLGKRGERTGRQGDGPPSPPIMRGVGGRSSPPVPPIIGGLGGPQRLNTRLLTLTGPGGS